ncbi:hypothetical protein [Treponema endosymbiont of Eucomonympha sp.]|uniref:hypothetical protein n=1 Tax=Treponema endosymbiont of Eucomonympha sp. TaxID=1580831 RepID=UPI000AB3E90A|nr:hypothetical protein [Treponema endosymbiont of Eucomonympha sp.]
MRRATKASLAYNMERVHILGTGIPVSRKEPSRRARKWKVPVNPLGSFVLDNSTDGHPKAARQCGLDRGKEVK